MLKNLNAFGGIIFSQRVLIALTEKGLSREEAYDIVQKNAFVAFNEENGNFKNQILEDGKVSSVLTNQEIEECFSFEYYLRNVGKIFERFEI